MEIKKFEEFLVKLDLSKNTTTSYLWSVNYFLSNYGDVNKTNLLAYKGFLVEHFKPQTVNLRLQAINKYLEFIKKEKSAMAKFAFIPWIGIVAGVAIIALLNNAALGVVFAVLGISTKKLFGKCNQRCRL